MRDARPVNAHADGIGENLLPFEHPCPARMDAVHHLNLKLRGLRLDDALVGWRYENAFRESALRIPGESEEIAVCLLPEIRIRS